MAVAENVEVGYQQRDPLLLRYQHERLPQLAGYVDFLVELAWLARGIAGKTNILQVLRAEIIDEILDLVVEMCRYHDLLDQFEIAELLPHHSKDVIQFLAVSHVQSFIGFVKYEAGQI